MFLKKTISTYKVVFNFVCKNALFYNPLVEYACIIAFQTCFV